MALYIKDKLVIDHCKTNDGIRLIMDWMSKQGDPPQIERHSHCIILTVKCYADRDSLKRMNATSNIVTIPLSKKDSDSDSICVNPFTVRKRRKKVSTRIWDDYSSMGYSSSSSKYSDYGFPSYDRKNKIKEIYEIFNDGQEYVISEENLTGNLRDFILTIPTIIRDKKISTILDV